MATFIRFHGPSKQGSGDQVWQFAGSQCWLGRARTDLALRRGRKNFLFLPFGAFGFSSRGIEERLGLIVRVGPWSWSLQSFCGADAGPCGGGAPIALAVAGHWNRCGRDRGHKALLMMSVVAGTGSDKKGFRLGTSYSNGGSSLLLDVNGSWNLLNPFPSLLRVG